jgi:RNA polymerase sigma factor (sigma-70 family)
MRTILPGVLTEVTINLDLAASGARSDSGEDPQVRAHEFTVVFATDERRLFALALSILRNPVEAEDAVQMTAVRAWKGWHQRADDAATSRWLTSICVRQCLTRRRILLLRRATTVELTEQLASYANDTSTDGFDFELDEAYRKLSARQRAVISLHYHQGYQLSECADLMHCSTGAVASHLSRALAKLRKEVSRDG